MLGGPSYFGVPIIYGRTFNQLAYHVMRVSKEVEGLNMISSTAFSHLFIIHVLYSATLKDL